MINIDDIVELLVQEYKSASDKFEAFNSAHEGWGVIREEYLELEQEICKKYRDKEKMKLEAVHLGAMAMRFVYDVCNDN